MAFSCNSPFNIYLKIKKYVTKEKIYMVIKVIRLFLWTKGKGYNNI